MRTIRRRPYLHIAAFAGLGCGLPWIAAAQQPRAFRFSPVNQYGIELTARYWNPIIDHVSRRSGVRLELKLGRTSADTTSYALANEVEFLFSNHLFTPERERLGWRIFARRSTPAIHGALVVLAGSALRRLEDLDGKVVGFPGPEATVSYKFTYAKLLERKINVQVVFGGNTDGALAQLASGKVAAVGVNTQLAEGWAKREGRPLRELWRSGPVYDLPLLAARSVPDADLQAVKAAFIGMKSDPEGRQILQATAAMVKLEPDTVFVTSDSAEYEVYREFFRSAPPQLR
jgi:phosphonate transport system substrate-binding protein